MRVAWRATRVTFDEDEDVLVCGLCGDGPRPYLILSREPEDADPADDWGVHLEYDDQIYSDYDAVESCRLAGRSFSVDLSRPLGSLADVEGFDVELDVEPATLDAFRAGLLRVFWGREGVLSFG